MAIIINNGSFKLTNGVFTSIEPINTPATITYANTVLLTTVGTSTWTKPAGVTQVLVECWGGGGAGGGATVNQAGGAGGGGGGYSRSILTYSSGLQSLSYTVGAGGTTSTGAGGNGNDTTWQTSVVIARGGEGGQPGNFAMGSATEGAGGGINTSNVGDIIYSGGYGGIGWGGNSGGGLGAGGGAAGSLGPGDSPQYLTDAGGLGTSEFGGNGAAGSSGGANLTGTAGSNYGGGGSGGTKISGVSRSGGAGAQGLIRVSYN